MVRVISVPVVLAPPWGPLLFSDSQVLIFKFLICKMGTFPLKVLSGQLWLI